MKSLKKIIENLDKIPTKGFTDTPKLTTEQKNKLMNMVGRYNEYGNFLRNESALVECAKTLEEISSMAEIYACNEAADWFQQEVIKNDFKRAKGINETFQKVSKECYSKLQQLNALYEDMGHILGRYYEIKDPVQEVLPTPSNIQNQRQMPANGSIREVDISAKNANIKGQRELPHVNGPATPQLKEVDVTAKNANIKGQRELPHTNGPAPTQIKETDVCGKNANIKSQRDCPSGGPTSYNPPKDPKDTGSVKEVTHNEANLQSQRELPQGGPESYTPPKFDAPSVPVNPAGSGECNVKGERDVPQGGPAKDPVYNGINERMSLRGILKTLKK